MTERPASTGRNRTLIVAVGIILPLAMITALLIYTLNNSGSEQPVATPSVTFTPSESETPTVPTPTIEDDHAHGDADEVMTKGDSKKATTTATKYLDAWATVKGEKARRKAMSGLATPANIDLMALTDPRNMDDVTRKGKVEVVTGDAYSATIKAPLSSGESVYLILLRDPSATHGWTVAYLYPEDDYDAGAGSSATGEGA